MDLEGFDAAVQTPRTIPKLKTLSFSKAVKLVDDVWYVKATRSARWMDLLGDYAGNEPFVIDGEALFQIILDDPLLSIGREGCNFQILHAYYMLERILGDYQRRSANIEIVFWHKRRHISMATGNSTFTVASRALARSMLFQHLQILPFKSHVFEDLVDPLWVQYAMANRPMFIMTSDGGLHKKQSTALQAAAIFFSGSLGISVALLKGAEYRDSKILSFVYEPAQNNVSLLNVLRPLSGIADTRLRDHLSNGLPQATYHLLAAASLNRAEINLTDFLLELNVMSAVERGVPPEVVFLFIVHILLLPSLSVSERAQAYRPLSSDLTDLIRQEFFSPLFYNAADYLASRHHPFQVDGAILMAMISFIISERGQALFALGSTLFSEAERLWSALSGPTLDFQEFAKQYPLPQQCTEDQDRMIESIGLLEFSNPVFDEEFSTLQIPGEICGKEEPGPRHYFDPGTKLSDTRHWHNQKSILPSHQGGSSSKLEDPRARSRRLRSEQRFMSALQVQAASLTGASGASLRQIIIVPVGLTKTDKDPISKAAAPRKKITPALSSADKLRLKIKEEKDAKQKDASEARWTHFLSTISDFTLSQKVAAMTDFSRNQKLDAPAILLEMRLFNVNLELHTWVGETDRDSDLVRDRYTVSIMRAVKDIFEAGIVTLQAKKVLTTVLIALGFNVYVSNIFPAAQFPEGQRLSFSFIKLLDSKTKSPRYPFMAIQEHPVIWQLRVFGEYMDRSMDSAPDTRVSFEPDAWQRKVLDGIDKNKSLLVVAPTSAGKTFISYYAMEKVLRESDDGILVYVAPTKALVTQITAEVYARFSKNLNGRSCWAIHTRDFRIHDPQKCQILVTVPEMLAIMLLSPPLATVWTPRIKRIILDEIHSIGQQEGGAVWEQIILFAPCPIIGLSATIGSPDVFSRWLESVQEAHGFAYEFIEHRNRYSHLRKFFYQIDGKGRVSSLGKHSATNRAKFLHPISLLSFGPRSLPPDLSLEARDTLTLYNALLTVNDQISTDLEPLDPRNFFPEDLVFLRQQDILLYESKLKDILIGLLAMSDPQDVSSPIGRVIQVLDPTMMDMANIAPAPTAFQNDLLMLLADLFAKNELPAILFNFDRTNCEIMAQSLIAHLESLEHQWRSEDARWIQKMKEWNLWKSQSKAREKALDKLKKRKKTNDENDKQDDSDPSWQSSFDPEDPSPEFSFVGRRSHYSYSDLEKQIEELRWTSIPSWAFDALKRGIGVHHAGMNKHYRSLVESLFRQGFIQVVIATGTLALGINAPAKTTIFCGDSPYLTSLMYRQCAGRAGRRGYDLRGNVVFYGLPADRVRRLVLSKLPTLGGNFPATSTMTLRLFNLLDGSKGSDFARHAIKSIMSLPHITLNSDIGREQLLHHLRFSIEYLRRSGLLDGTGKPVNLFIVATHLYYAEPSNFAFVALMRAGVFHRICNRLDAEDAKKGCMMVLCNLFGRRYLSQIFANERNIEELTQKYPSMVVLPPLPEDAQDVLIQHEAEILRIFTGYAFAFASQYGTKIGPDDTLPLSCTRYSASDEGNISPLRAHLRKAAIPVTIRSSFVANSGHNDSFNTVFELCNTARTGLNLNGHAIPTMSPFTTNGGGGLEHRLNAYILDFYIHGQVSTLAKANCIRRGDVWYLLQDFMLTLMTVKTGLQQLLWATSIDANAEKDSDTSDLKTYDIGDDFAIGEGETGSEDAESLGLPDNASPADKKVYRILTEICSEFEEKFRAMWA
ncbi:hypothetical protein CPB84DRAFT_1966141 [Gymnopilus junonius]|uniref:P-loop containing nucleoside triphosphate hydrolase protein n=1 Tax=Gymnopilus junonius TaxID=109634 RepID=A0A9P5TIA8_GYMJU|nr:hypothetical protein CPB84DRAFT_1966141 [Gymnopilus junonius]